MNELKIYFKYHVHDPKQGSQPGTTAVCPECKGGWYRLLIEGGVVEMSGHPCSGGDGRFLEDDS